MAAWLRRPRRGPSQPLFRLALAACAGILAADVCDLQPWWGWLAALAGAGLVAWKRRTAGSCLLLGAVLFAHLHHWNDRDALRTALHTLAEPGGEMNAGVTGVVCDAPEPDASGRNFRFPLRIETLETTLLPDEFPGFKLYVQLSEAAESPRYGDRIYLQGVLRRPQAPRNPGEFDFPAFLHREGLSAEFEASLRGQRLEVLAEQQGSPLVASALRARDWIGAVVTEGIQFDPEMAATVRAMVLGTREQTPAEVKDAFIASGTMHVFAVSGLHVAMFCIVIFWLLRRTPLSYGWILAIALPLVFFYVVITGLRPSAWRAAIMCAVYLCAPLGDRESRVFNSLGASALLLLTWNTQQLFQPGFSLSFGVILAIAALQPLVRQLFGRAGEPDPFLPPPLRTRRQRMQAWVSRFVVNSVSVSAASTAGSALLMIHYFHLITPVGIVANILLVMLSNFILVVACVSILMAGTGLGALALLANKVNWLLAVGTVKSAQFFAAIPGGHWNVEPSRWWRGDLCEITVLDLDNGGGALHVDTPGGAHWLVDAGGLRHFFRTVRPHLTSAPVNRLEGMILTHSDAYHTGGAEDVRRVFRPRSEPVLRAGDELLLEPGIRLRCLFPPPGWNAPGADDRCAVFMLTCRETRILIMNDAGFLTEKALLESGEELRADVLIKGRHGSDFSGLPEFLNAVHPQAVVFTNSDFPLSESVPVQWKEMVAAKGPRLFDQRRTGAVILRIESDSTVIRGFCDGSEFQVKRPL